MKDPSTRQIVLDVNKHQHFNKSCRKNGPNCKYNFPRFPCLRTIIAIPSKIKYKDDEEKEKEKLAESKRILKKVKQVLEDEEFMKNAIKLRNEEIENHIRHEDIMQNINLIIEERKLTDPDPRHNTEKVLNAYNEYAQDDIDNLDDVTDDDLEKLKVYHKTLQDKIPMKEIKKERLDTILIKAEIKIGKTFEQRNDKYEEALSLSSKGYTVSLKRDIDEIYINGYNPEWIKAWNGNVDLQPCFDYFGIITYVTDYYMKDESGTVGLMKEVLKNSSDESLRKKMQLVKNAFLTGL